MDPVAVKQLADRAIVLFGKTSPNSILISEFNENVIEVEVHKQLIDDVEEIINSIEPLSAKDNENFVQFIRTIRESDNFTAMHILSVMSKYKHIELIGNALTHWVQIAKDHKHVDQA